MSITVTDNLPEDFVFEQEDETLSFICQNFGGAIESTIKKLHSLSEMQQRASSQEGFIDPSAKDDL